MAVPFSQSFNVDAALRSGQHVRFGADVLSDLVDGIDDFRGELERNSRSRSLGPAMLGAFMWVDDPELLRRIATYPAACVVICKQIRRNNKLEKIKRVEEAIRDAPGFPAHAFVRLETLQYHQDGKTPVMGASSQYQDVQVSAVRTIGHRREGQHLVPILHTKMVLLGEIMWHDEDPLGGAADVTLFRPWRLWLGSANGTESSRRSLEFGLWLKEQEYLEAAQKFLVEVLANSEDLDPDSDAPCPDLVEPEFDDDAMVEAWASLMEEYEGRE